MKEETKVKSHARNNAGWVRKRNTVGLDNVLDRQPCRSAINCLYSLRRNERAASVRTCYIK